MRIRQKVDSNGKIYLPRLLRQQGFDKIIEIAPNTRCFLAYSPEVPLSQILDSMDIIRRDLETSGISSKPEKRNK